MRRLWQVTPLPLPPPPSPLLYHHHHHLPTTPTTTSASPRASSSYQLLFISKGSGYEGASHVLRVVLSYLRGLWQAALERADARTHAALLAGDRMGAEENVCGGAAGLKRQGNGWGGGRRGGADWICVSCRLDRSYMKRISSLHGICKAVLTYMYRW